MTYFIHYAIIQDMNEQFITPTQPEGKPDTSDWDAIAEVVSKEVGASKGLAIDYDTLPLTHEAMGLPSPKEGTDPDSATGSISQETADPLSELDSDNKQV